MTLKGDPVSLRAVVFDYGMVLSGPPQLDAHQQLKSITGLSHDEFERYYWADRHAFDRGDYTGLEYWQKLASDASLTLTPAQIEELSLWDARLWTTTNAEMLAWFHIIRQKGFKTAILSNMGDSVLANMKAAYDWLDDFDVLIWSYQHKMAKPQPEIYHLLLEKLGIPPEEILFLDDKLENIEAARRQGIQCLQFSTIEQLRQDLISANLDPALPLP